MKKPSRLRLAFLLCLLFISIGLLVRKHFFRTPLRDGLPISGGTSMNVQIKAPLFKQWDNHWSDCKLGATESTIEHAGCTVCAVAMGLSSQGFPINPRELSEQLKSHNGFTSTGLMIWSQIQNITKGRFLIHLDDHPSFVTIDNQLAKGNPLIAKVLYGGAIWHWVLITGKVDHQFIINDPLSPGSENESMIEYPRGIYAIRYL